MSHFREFKQIYESFTESRRNILTIIFEYLKMDNIQGLVTYYTQGEVKNLLLKDELSYLDGLAKKYYGPGATDAVPDIKSH
jgi:hypothetical protein